MHTLSSEYYKDIRPKDIFVCKKCGSWAEAQFFRFFLSPTKRIPAVRCPNCTRSDSVSNLLDHEEQRRVKKFFVLIKNGRHPFDISEDELTEAVRCREHGRIVSH